MDVIKGFREWLAADDKMEKTIASYTGDARGFLEWVQDQGKGEPDPVKNFTRDAVLSYREHLLSSGYAVATVNKKVNSLASFNRYLVGEEVLEAMAVRPGKDRVQIARGSGSSIETYSEEEVEEILKYVDRKEVSRRDRMIVHLLLYTGVRVSELCDIKLQDLDLLSGELKVIGKGGKYREIPLNAKALASIRDYTQTERGENKHSESDYLLLTERSPKAHRDAVNHVLNRIGGELGLKIYPHKFRHTTFTLLLKKGVDIATVSEIAGHSSIETTHRYYLATSAEEKRRAVEAL